MRPPRMENRPISACGQIIALLEAASSGMSFTYCAPTLRRLTLLGDGFAYSSHFSRAYCSVCGC